MKTLRPPTYPHAQASSRNTEGTVLLYPISQSRPRRLFTPLFVVVDFQNVFEVLHRIFQ